MDSVLRTVIVIFFFFNDTATTEIYTLSLHDALPISLVKHADVLIMAAAPADYRPTTASPTKRPRGSGTLTLELRSEEHTSELQSQSNLVCRLLLEKKKLIKSLTTSTRPERRVAISLF